MLSLRLFLLRGVDSTFGRSGMNSADVVGTGGTEYLSIKVVYVTIFSRSQVSWTLPCSQGIYAGKMIGNPGRSSSALLPSSSALPLKGRCWGRRTLDFLGRFAAGSSPAYWGKQSEEWAGQITHGSQVTTGSQQPLSYLPVPASRSPR